MHDGMPYYGITRSKVKVMRPLKLEILQFSKSISAIFNVILKLRNKI